MIITVSGIENFIGNMKRRYRGVVFISDEPERRLDDFEEELGLDYTRVDGGVIEWVERPALFEMLQRWEADPRRLVADFVSSNEVRAQIFYRLYERAH